MLSEKLLRAMETDQVFERPLGPHPNCFSTSQVARMFESGASPDELRHLFECAVCNDLVARSTQLGRMLGIEKDPATAKALSKRIFVASATIGVAVLFFGRIEIAVFAAIVCTVSALWNA